MGWSLFCVGVVALLSLLYSLVRLVQLVFSDCDLQLRACAPKPEYFKDKVVWLVGASGGSKGVGSYLEGFFSLCVFGSVASLCGACHRFIHGACEELFLPTRRGKLAREET